MLQPQDISLPYRSSLENLVSLNSDIMLMKLSRICLTVLQQFHMPNGIFILDHSRESRVAFRHFRLCLQLLENMETTEDKAAKPCHTAARYVATLMALFFFTQTHPTTPLPLLNLKPLSPSFRYSVLLLFFFSRFPSSFIYFFFSSFWVPAFFLSFVSSINRFSCRLARENYELFMTLSTLRGTVPFIFFIFFLFYFTFYLFFFSNIILWIFAFSNELAVEPSRGMRTET